MSSPPGLPDSRPEAPRSRSRMIVGIVIVAAVLAIAVVVSFALTRTSDSARPAPTSTASATPTASAAATPTPSASSTSPTASSATIDVNGDGFTLSGSAGETFSHTWAAPAAPAIAALTEAFGAAPTISEDLNDGNFHRGNFTVYSWPDFTFYDYLDTEGGKDRSEVDTPTYVSFSASSIGDIEITNEFGLRIGQTLDEVRQLAPDSGGDTVPPIFWFVRGRSTFYEDGVRSYGVQVDTDGEHVTSITYKFIATGL